MMWIIGDDYVNAYEMVIGFRLKRCYPNIKTPKLKTSGSSKNETLTQCWINVGLLSATSVQH